MKKFNAAAARAKRPCPLWIDAFQRDTQHLQADEVGAYLLILMAMWTRESCDFPDDDARLARVARVSTRLWKSRIGPTIRAFFRTDAGALVSKRLREEATYTERQVQQQSDRKVGEKPGNPREPLDPTPSADASADQPRNHPTQLPNNPTKEEKKEPPPPATSPARDGQAVAVADHEHDEVLIAAGIDPAKDVTGKWHNSTAKWEIERWRALLSHREILDVLGETKPPGLPGSLAYFTKAMQRAAGRKSAPPLQPTTADGTVRPPSAERFRRIATGYGT